MKTLKLFLIFFLIFSVSYGVEAKEKKYKNGDFYSGEWKKGKPNGQGKMTFANGDVYEGLWIDGKIAGDGELTNENGFFRGSFLPIYENDVLVNIKPIKGISVTKNGRFIGEWAENDVFNGEYSFNGMKYTGIMKGAEFTQGRLENGFHYLEGSKLLTPEFEGNLNYYLEVSPILDKPAWYNGEFKNGKFIGKISGTNLTNSISTFDINQDESGKQDGTMGYKNGSKYQGEIKNFKRDGIGTLTKDGVSIEGSWINDKITSGTAKETVKNSENGKYQTFNFEISNGKASYTFPDGEILVINNDLNGSSLYPQVEKRQNEKDELARQELLRQKEEERKLARAKDAKEIDQKYAGMVFQGEGSLDMISGDGELALLGFLFGTQMTQTITVTFLPGGKVRVRETASNVSRDTTSQAMAMARNQDGGHVYEATINGNRIDLGPFYLIVASDKKSLGIYGPDGDGYKLKRK